MLTLGTKRRIAAVSLPAIDAGQFFLDISGLSHYNLIRIFDCHRVVSESACLHIVRS